MTDYSPSLNAQELKERFAEIAPLLSPIEAKIEADRCLYCYDAPCTRACPTNIDVPMFIKQIASSDTRGAAKTIFTENILGSSCGRACPTEVLCEGACVYNSINDKPIQIGRLQRFASDHAIENNIQFWKTEKASGKKVAIVGAGAASLACAYELTKQGHKCTIFEASAQAGGLNTYGIAGYKVDTESALREVAYITDIGIEIRTNCAIGRDTSFIDLQSDYDAVFLGIGLGKTASLGIPGEDLPGCMEALEFIRPTRDLQFSDCKVGKKILVVGGGNTSIDAATAAIRMGSRDVTILYRRTQEQMPAYKHEFELAKAHGVKFAWLTKATKVVEENGEIVGLECLNLELGKDKSLNEVEGSDHIIPCDMVVKALGQKSRSNFIEESGIAMNKGAIEVEKDSFATSLNGVFAGGDCVNSGAELVDAVQHGKLAARGIDKYLNS